MRGRSERRVCWLLKCSMHMRANSECSEASSLLPLSRIVASAGSSHTEVPPILRSVIGSDTLQAAGSTTETVAALRRTLARGDTDLQRCGLAPSQVSTKNVARQREDTDAQRERVAYRVHFFSRVGSASSGLKEPQLSVPRPETAVRGREGTREITKRERRGERTESATVPVSHAASILSAFQSRSIRRQSEPQPDNFVNAKPSLPTYDAMISFDRREMIRTRRL